MNGLTKVLPKLQGEKVRLYFVTPEDVYSKFQAEQKYLTDKREARKSVPWWVTGRVEQWVLKVNYSQFSRMCEVYSHTRR